jgi:hypothetical protein
MDCWSGERWTFKAQVRRIEVQSQSLANSSREPISRKTLHKRLVE